ncbi:MAG: coiled coil domain-containing protein [Hydrogenovibrio sp.]|nr:coiled coil domain-containing protein [Hydrogenovibrio sp.]
MSKKDAYENKLRAQLEEWRAEIDLLKAKAHKAEANLQIDYYQKIEELNASMETARKKLSELEDASGGAWEDIKIGLENAWDDLEAAIDSAKSRFK